MGLLGAIAGGVGVLGFLQDESNKKATAKAVQAQIDAADKNRALFERIYTESRDDQAPGRAIYAPAVNAAAQRLGLAPVNGSGAPGPASFSGAPAGAYSALPGTRRAAGPGAGQPMGVRADGSAPMPGNDGPPGPAPEGKEWVHGPEGYILRDIRPQTSFRDAIGGLGGKQRKSEGGFAGTSPIEPPPPGGQMDMSDPAFFAPTTAPAAAPASAPTGQPDFAAYGAANPDLQQEWQRIVSTGNADGFDNDPNAYYAWHYQQYGQNEGRNLPTSGGPAAPTPAPADPNAPPAEYYQETYAPRPDALEVPEFQRGPDVQFQDFGQGPSIGDFLDPSKFEIDPGYQFRLAEGLNAVNAASAARGKLRSGDAAKSLQARGEGLAAQGYQQWLDNKFREFQAARGTFESNRGFTENRDRYTQGRQDTNFLDDRSYGTNLWNTVQGRNDSVFSEDRGFAANRNDQSYANLFGLINVGQNAAAGTAAAGNTFANAAANQNSNVADARSNGALLNAQNRQNLFGSAARAAGMFAGGY